MGYHWRKGRSSTVIMSDDDMDLDAMLDEAADDALKDDGGADLLDEALDDVLGGNGGAVVPIQQQRQPSASSSVTSRGTARAAPKSEREYLEDLLTAVLPTEASRKWVSVIREDETRLATAPPPRPHSRAYRSLNSRGRGGGGGASGGGKGDEGAGGKGGASAEAGGAMTTGPEKGHPQPARALQELLLRAASKAGIKDTEGIRKAFLADEGGTIKRLEELFMVQMAEDLKDKVASDPDFDPKRFPCTAQRVLGLGKDL